jgi:hypothetical protein
VSFFGFVDLDVEERSLRFGGGGRAGGRTVVVGGGVEVKVERGGWWTDGGGVGVGGSWGLDCDARKAIASSESSATSLVSLYDRN